MAPARLTCRAFVLAVLAGIAVLLFSAAASAETCETECEAPSDTARPHLLGSSLDAVNGLVPQPVGRLLGQGNGAQTSPADTAAPVPANAAASAAEGTPAEEGAPAEQGTPAAAPQGLTPEAAEQATSTALPSPSLTASTPSLVAAEPVVSTVTATVEAVVPVASTATAPARELLEGQSVQDVVATTTDAITDLGAAAVPAVAATAKTLEATARQLLDTARTTTTAALDSAQMVLATTAGSLQPVTFSVTGALATVLGGSASPAAQADPGSGVKQVGGATLVDTLPVVGTPLPGVGPAAVTSPESVDGQVPVPPPDRSSDGASIADDGGSAIVLTGQHSAPVPASSGAGAANGGGTSGPSATELGKLFFDLVPAAPQPGFLPAMHQSVHVPSAPVVEPAQSPD